MEAIVRLYSSKREEINRFLNNYFNEKHNYLNLLEWEKKYQNPVEITDIIGAFIDNNDRYSINMWISLDEGFFINVTEENAAKIIRYIYERFPW